MNKQDGPVASIADESIDEACIDYAISKDFIGKNIVLGVCGGIAAYKSAYLVRALVELGANVRVVMTQSAVSFISPITFQALSGESVRLELFDANEERAMSHIALARWADYIVIAPASANFLAKMAHGLADDLLSTLYLVATVPVIVCPAMNRSMWSHPATQENCALLKKRAVMLVGPDEGSQACGEVGLGRVAELPDILAALRLHPVMGLMSGKTVLITAGSTQESIDPVRYISNRSSGKMGYALASAAQVAGAHVTLISGPSALVPPIGVHCIQVRTAAEMLTQVMAQLKSGDIFIGAAAVADYHVAEPLNEKLKKQDHDTITLTLKKNPDILGAVVERQEASLVVGFSAETHEVLTYAEEKRRRKKVDMMIANKVGQGLGFDSDFNQVTLISEQGHVSLDLAHKTTLSGQIIAIIAQFKQQVALRKTDESIYTN